MMNSSSKINVKRVYLSISAMLLGVFFVDVYGIIIKFLGDTYSTMQLALFRNAFAIGCLPKSKNSLNIF